MTASWRFSALADRHRALGSTLADWNGMGTAWDYDGDQRDEYLAVRTKAGLMDVSGLKKVHLVGPHASFVLDYASTRDVSKIHPGKSAYACMLNDAGKFVDDCILYRTGPNSWMMVHGSGAAHEQVVRTAQGRNVAVLFDDDLHDISLQGPLAVDFLERHVAGIRTLPYFHHIQTRLFDAPVMLSRTGYTGERGYEIFCRGQDAPAIWDTILSEGKDLGIKPCRFTTLDWFRVESSLMFYPYDNSQMYPYANEAPGDTLWELGLDFTVSPSKDGFRGAEEHYRLKGRERFRIYGIELTGETPAAEGDPVHNAAGERVGLITCSMVSPLTKRCLAIARLDVAYAVAGTPLEVRGSITAKATAQPMPFYDPKKERRTARD